VLLLELIVKSRRLTKDFCASRPRCKKTKKASSCDMSCIGPRFVQTNKSDSGPPRPREILKVEAPGMHATYMTAWHIVNDQSEK
jgi:hypothetical protein